MIIRRMPIRLLPLLVALVISWFAVRALAAPPQGVGTIIDINDRFILFDGAANVSGSWVPDGRVWRFDRLEREVVLVTPQELFGEHFFATGAALLAGEQVLVKVNADDDPGNLFRVEPIASTATLITDVERLKLADVIDHTFFLSPDGRTLAFTAFREQLLDDPADAFVWRMGVYTLDLEAAVVEESLHLWAEDDLFGAPTLLLPVFTADGTLEILTTDEAVPWQVRSVEELAMISDTALEHADPVGVP